MWNVVDLTSILMNNDGGEIYMSHMYHDMIVMDIIAHLFKNNDVMCYSVA